MSRNHYGSWCVMLAAFVWSLAFHGCFGQRSIDTALVSGTSCTKLVNPKHGAFECTQTPTGEKCVLVCKAGYVLPITEYHVNQEHLELNKRGTYNCIRLPGGLIWTPTLLFDCVETLYPIYLLFYFGLSLPPYPDTCSNSTDREFFLEAMDPNNQDGNAVPLCLMLFKITCVWTYDMLCVDEVWRMDAWFRVPFTLALLSSYEAWEKNMKTQLHEDCQQFFVLNSQIEPTAINQETFTLECPQGTRLEKDFTCRGCSKGFFMSPILAECIACPPETYQDENFATRCKSCPAGSAVEQTGLTSLQECFRFSVFEEDTSMFTLMVPLTCIVIMSGVLLAYRSLVVNEPDGIRRETYKFPVYKPVGGGYIRHLMRILYPTENFPSEFDSMFVSPENTTFQRTRASSGFTMGLSKGGNQMFIADRKSAQSGGEGSEESYESDES